MKQIIKDVNIAFLTKSFLKMNGIIAKQELTKRIKKLKSKINNKLIMQTNVILIKKAPL